MTLKSFLNTQNCYSKTLLYLYVLSKYGNKEILFNKIHQDDIVKANQEKKMPETNAQLNNVRTPADLRTECFTLGNCSDIAFNFYQSLHGN